LVGEDLAQQDPDDRSPRNGKAGDVEEHAQEGNEAGGLGGEAGAKGEHGDGHDERADDLEGLAAEAVHGHDGDDGEDEVDGADDDGLEERGVGIEADVLEDLGCVIEDDIDADELLEDGEHDADENQERAEGEQAAGMMLGKGDADLGDFALGFDRAGQFAEDGAGAGFVAPQHEVTGRFGDEHEEQEEREGGNGAGGEHVAPADLVEPGIAVADTGNAVVDEIDDEHAEDDGELVPSDEIAADFGGRNLGDVHGRKHGGQAHADAAEDAVKDEVNHVRRAAVTDGGEEEFGGGGTERGHQEEHGGNDQSPFAADVGADPAAQQAADDAADERAGCDEAQQGVGGVRVGEMARVNEVGAEAAHGTGDDGGVVAKQQTAKRRGQSQEDDVGVQAGHRMNLNLASAGIKAQLIFWSQNLGDYRGRRIRYRRQASHFILLPPRRGS